MNVLFIEVTAMCKELMCLYSQNFLERTMKYTFVKRKAYRKYKQSAAESRISKMWHTRGYLLT